MPPYKRNQFLDAEDSNDEESQGYNSEEQELQKGGHNGKNRNNGEAQTSQEDYQPRNEGRQTQGSELDDEGKAQEETDRNEKKVKDYQKPPELLKSLNKKNLVATEMAIRKSGVVYLSRIPPFMKLVKLRSLLEPYGTINRIFLAPEDPVAHARRVRNGGNKRKLHTEGWVEFVNKKDAKKACELLNGRAIGGKKGSYYCDDIWNLVYLKGFKWHNLTEQVAAENAERSSRMRAEVSKTTRENKEFVRNVERAKMLEGIQSKAATKRKRKRPKKDDDESGGEEDASAVSAPAQERRWTFNQTSLAKKREREEQPEQVKRILSKIF